LRTPRVVVVMPAYNAARTLVRTYRDIPPGVVDHVILVDDLSRDDNLRDTFQRYRSCFERLLAT
jgi:glycosyltransferase involved in cell wall biosynthesis